MRDIGHFWKTFVLFLCSFWLTRSHKYLMHVEYLPLLLGMVIVLFVLLTFVVGSHMVVGVCNSWWFFVAFAFKGCDNDLAIL